MIPYTEDLKGRSVLWRPAGVDDWCDPRVGQGVLVADERYGLLILIELAGKDLIVQPKNLLLGRKVIK